MNSLIRFNRKKMCCLNSIGKWGWWG